MHRVISTDFDLQIMVGIVSIPKCKDLHQGSQLYQLLVINGIGY